MADIPPPIDQRCLEHHYTQICLIYCQNAHIPGEHVPPSHPIDHRCMEYLQHQRSLTHTAEMHIILKAPSSN